MRGSRAIPRKFPSLTLRIAFGEIVPSLFRGGSRRLPLIPGDEFFGLWIRSLIVVNVILLVIDIVDVARYAAGDRLETVSVS